MFTHVFYKVKGSPCKSQSVCVCSVVSDSANPWTEACQSCHATFQARTLAWVVVSYSRGSMSPVLAVGFLTS